MSEKPYYVIFTGRLQPTVDLATVKSNLVLGLNIAEEKAVSLLSRDGEVLLKRCATIGEAQLLVEKFENAGVICVIRDDGPGSVNQQAMNNGESSLVRLLKSFSPGSPKKGGSSSFMARMSSSFSRK